MTAISSIMIIDFGGQTAHLIGRRLKSQGVTTQIVLPEKSLKLINHHAPAGIILSGGPSSVYSKNAPTIDKSIFKLGIPILGICYGLQLTAHLLGGEVVPGNKKELGPAVLHLSGHSPLFASLPKEFGVWMSHGDHVKNLPTGSSYLGYTDTIKSAAFSNEKRRLYAIQFHPEVDHTEYGTKILGNFAHLICGLPLERPLPTRDTVQAIVKSLKTRIGTSTAICALSGGVDSSVAATLVASAIGANLVCIYIDSGLMREGETKAIKQTFGKIKLNLKIIDAKKLFLTRLKGLTKPEDKRKIIGKTFIDVLEKSAKQTKAKFLVQGTIYPDVIESQGTKHSQRIKSHHNVGGLPKNMKLKLIEPLREFYKDEVRLLGKSIGLPKAIIERQPYPGPGLAIRIIGEVTPAKLAILRRADSIVTAELGKVHLPIWQAFAIFTGIKTTGIKGDARAYGETIAIRAINTKDAMSASWVYLPHKILNLISLRLVDEIKEVNRVVYDITNKPPGTIEWE